MQKSYLFLLLLLIFPLVSANGLVISNNTMSINKTFGSDYITSLTISNQEAVTFYNISFDGASSYLTMAQIPELTSGQSITVPLTIKSDENVNTQLKLKGYYFTNVGVQNKVWDVAVNPYTSSPCSFSITRGDTVKWTSNIVNTISLKEYPSNTPVDASTLATNQSLTKLYDVVGSKTYQWFVGSWGFGELCTITTMSENGYVNDPQLDGVLNLNILTGYEPTNLTAQLFKTNYTIDFYAGDEGTVFITNTGTKVAKNIMLTGDWFVFDSNNFDLNPGYSKSVTYRITPVAITTAETNQTYSKTFTITGNFETLSQHFSIFVNYADISTNASQNSSSDFLQWVCSHYPDLCQPKVVYKFVTNGSGSQTLNISADQWRDYNLDLQNEKAARQTLYNLIKAKDSENANSSAMTAQQISELKSLLAAMDKQNKDNQDGQRLAWIVLGSVLLIGGMVAVGVIIYYRKHKESQW